MQFLNNPFEPLQIKWEVYILLKKSSCVFLPASFIRASVVYHASVIIASVCIQYIYVYNNLAQSAGAVEYIDHFSAEGLIPNDCTGYDIKH